MNIKLKTWILAGYLVMMLLVVLLSGFGIYFIERLNRASESILKDNYLSIEAAYNMIDQLDRLDNELARKRLREPGSEIPTSSKINEADSGFMKYLAIAEGNITEPGEGELLKQLREEYEKYKLLSAIRADSSEGQYYNKVLLPQYELVKVKCYSLLKINEAPILRKNEISKEISGDTILYMIIISVFSLLITIIALIKIPGNVIRPILEMTRKVEAISRKKYGERLEVRSDNELGQLAFSFNAMAEKLSEYEKSSLDKLIAEKKRTEAIVANLRDGMLVVDENNRIILVNKVAIELLGISQDELIGNDIAECAKNNNLVENIAKELLNSGENTSVEKLNYIRIVFKEREEFYLKEITRVYDEQDTTKILGVIIILKNVTGFKELDEIKSGFVATVSHELKTPLAAMNMSLRLLQDNRMGELNTEQKKITEAMKEEVKRLLKMVNELLNLSRLETGGEVYKYQNVSVEDVVDSAVTPMLMQFEQHGINFDIDMQTGLPPLRADANKIAWVLINLLGNAIRYSNENGNIKLIVKREANDVMFCVKDNGIGIKPEYINRIFDKFVQIKHSNIEKQNKGVGLGLAISKEFVEAHRGKIWAVSNPGKGSEFYFTVPVKE